MQRFRCRSLSLLFLVIINMRPTVGKISTDATSKQLISAKSGEHTRHFKVGLRPHSTNHISPAFQSHILSHLNLIQSFFPHVFILSFPF